MLRHGYHGALLVAALVVAAAAVAAAVLRIGYPHRVGALVEPSRARGAPGRAPADDLVSDG